MKPSLILSDSSHSSLSSCKSNYLGKILK
uniref:Uncharacterized protein n=1 Tax=Arundo donax TaxID=35708 RepID=A0A0A9F0M0_ARUDO